MEEQKMVKVKRQGTSTAGDTTSSAAQLPITTTTTTTTTTTNAPADTTTRASQTQIPTTTSQPGVISNPKSTTTTASNAEESSASSRSSSSSASAAAATSSSAAAATSSRSASTVVTVITPTTVITVGTSTITSFLSPTTVTSTNSASLAGQSSGSKAGLSSGAKSGIIAGSVVAGVALLSLFLIGCLVLNRRRRAEAAAKENIKWPEIAASAEDRAALYPEQTHPTGRAGFGVGDEMEEAGLGAGVGAGMAGAGAYGGAQPTLPTFPENVYDQEYYGNGNIPHQPSFYTTTNSNSTPYSPPQSSYADFPSTNSAQSHAPLAPGEFQRETPSPPGRGATPGGGSSHGHGGYGGGGLPPALQVGGGGGSSLGHGQYYEDGSGGSGEGRLPLPGSELGHGELYPPEDVPGRSLSPTPMQVGDTFGQGYEEGTGRYRLSVVNRD